MSYRRAEIKQLVSKAERVAGDAGPFVDVRGYIEGLILVDVENIGANVTLKLFSETSPDAKIAYPHEAFNPITAAGKYTFKITNFGRVLRIRWDLDGTCKFGIDGVFKT